MELLKKFWDREIEKIQTKHLKSKKKDKKTKEVMTKIRDITD